MKITSMAAATAQWVFDLAWAGRSGWRERRTRRQWQRHQRRVRHPSNRFLPSSRTLSGYPNFYESEKDRLKQSTDRIVAHDWTRTEWTP